VKRTLFFFHDGDKALVEFDNKYFPLAILLNRLLSERYFKKKVSFINISFRTEETYKLHPQAQKHYIHNYGGMLSYDDVFDLRSFISKNEEERKVFIWKRAYEVLCEAAIATKNDEFLEACEYAYNKGIELELNPDYKMIEAEVVLHGVPVNAAVWVNFHKDLMSSKLTLEKDNVVLFEKHIGSVGSSELGTEFFLEAHKKIVVNDHYLIVKGHNEAYFLPLKVPIDEIQINKEHSCKVA